MHDGASITAARAFHYSPLRFLRRNQQALADHFRQDLEAARQKGAVERLGDPIRLHLAHLEWDSAFFGTPTYLLRFVEWDDDVRDPVVAVTAAIETLRRDLAARHERYYLFTEVPAEDLAVIQALGWARSRLIETRMTSFRADMHNYEAKRRYAVRVPTEADIDDLRSTAAESVNPYDRFHADPFFGADEAARFLAEFAGNSVRGFADIVLVPDDDRPPGAIITGRLVADAETLVGSKAARAVLCATSRSRPGWSYRLTVELACWLKAHNVGIFFMTTQPSNLPMIRVIEALGYGYGATSHIFSI